MENRQQSPSGKTSPGRSIRRTTCSGASSVGFWGALKPLKLKVANGLKQAFSVPKPSEWVIESSMPSTSGCPNSAGGSSSLPCRVSLLSILESGPVPQKYFLSAKACSGALQRAREHEKKLPEVLETALLAVAGEERPSDRPQIPPTAWPSTSAPKGAHSRPGPETPTSPTALQKAAAPTWRSQNPDSPRAIPTPKHGSPARSYP